MKSRRKLSLILGLVVLTALVLSGAMNSADAYVCGPGPHWVDYCMGGTDSFYSIAVVGVDIDWDGIPDITANLAGPTVIFRGHPIDTPDPLDPGHFNRINTEIVSMTLTGGGITLTAGDGIGNLANNGPLYSPGNVIEKIGDPTRADSFFDVSFTIQTPLGLLHSNTPVTVTASGGITEVPPIDTPYVFSYCAPHALYDVNNVPRAQLISAEHIPVIYWKDYNYGISPGGYMPDIDQNQDFDNVQVRTEESDPSISYQGTWTTVNDPGASGGKRNYADHPASYTFSFTGSSIKWIDTKAWNRGISEVWIDGNLMTTVDLYDPNIVNQVVLYSNSGLSSGPHTIQIKSTNTKNPASSGYLTSNDAFDVDDIEHEYCAPVAEANSLWWLDKAYGFGIFEFPYDGLGYIGGDVNEDGVADILDFVQELAWYKDTNGQRTGEPHTGTTVIDEQIGIHDFLVHYGLANKLYEHTVWDMDFHDWTSFFHYLEDEVKRSQDVKLDLGFWHVENAIQVGPGLWKVWWSRRGGHAVTVAGVDSPHFLFAISDPDNDAAEAGAPGVVRPGPHGYPHDPALHNNEMFASHDIYTVGPSPSPGGKMGLLNYPWKWNLPTHEWEWVGPVIIEWPEPLYESMTFTEIEAAVVISPIICGNGVLELGEECDDGNTNNGDGCSSTCKWEIMVLNPNGGEVIASGSSHTITWQTSTGAVKFDLQYSMNNGTSWTTIVTGIAGSSHNWTVPKPTANKTKCLVKVKGYDSSDVLLGVDVSDATFTIEVVKVTAPNGGENWKVGSTHAITWTTNGTKKPVAKVKLFYTTGGGIWNLIKTVIGNPGTSNWKVPAAASANCKVKVVLKDALGKTMGTDVSDAVFSIGP